MAEFQPTRPLRGATLSTLNCLPIFRTIFQPTRPLRGATYGSRISTWQLHYFNPRAPCGARPTAPLSFPAGMAFQPTRPLRGATVLTMYIGEPFS